MKRGTTPPFKAMLMMPHNLSALPAWLQAIEYQRSKPLYQLSKSMTNPQSERNQYEQA